MPKKCTYFFFISLSCLSLLACAVSELTLKTNKPRNIVYMIGDGMGVSYLTAYRYYKNQLSKNNKVQPTLFDQYWLGMSSTYPLADTWVTDSAASATALSSGIKTFNGAVGVDGSKQPVALLFDYARDANKKTGLIATSSITHATPASFYARHENRRDAAAIADQFIDHQRKGAPVVDLAIGGGQDFFERSDRNVISELREKGYAYAKNTEQLQRLNALPAIALLAPNELDAALDDGKQRLRAMVKKGLSLLDPASSQDGFVLVVEGSQIDWCGHQNDIACAMAEMEDFENAFEAVMEFAKADGNTLVIVTADHETGGLSSGAEGAYQWETAPFRSLSMSVKAFANILLVSENINKLWVQEFGYPLEKEELIALNTAVGVGHVETTTAVKKIINTRSFTGWATGGHTAQDVPVMAFGPGSETFIGFQDNTDIAKKLISFLSSN